MADSQIKPQIEKFLRPFQAFLHAEASGGILLLICTVIALVWANTPFAESYFHLWYTYISINISDFSLNYSLHHWINDGLMAIFFFVVGLEIKREFLVGELSSAQKAALPVAGALGGMIFPALLYTVFNLGKEGSCGWGIPMATDIAFVVGILALLGNKVPVSLKIFIIALAIADDIGAVLVIAVFYTAGISFFSLLIAAGFTFLLIISNLLGIKNLLVYTILGIGLWLAFLFSGVHATVAGVLLAFTIPATSRINSKEFMEEGVKLLKDFDDAGEEVESTFTNEERLIAAQALEANCEKVMTPLSRFESGLHPWVSFFIMPLFALANAGVSLGENFALSLTNPISIGIITGLFLGKQFGIFIFSWIAIKLKIAAKPEGVSWNKIYAAGILAGIGFTMSLFIANLAFTEQAVLLDISKVGILSASLISGIVGFIVLKKALNSADANVRNS